jgi:hypothetical protein
VAWKAQEKAALVAASAREERERAEPPNEEGEGFDKARVEAVAMAPGHYGTLLWVDYRCQLAKMHALDAWHLENQRLYYDSGKPVQVERIGLRGAKSTTKCRALVNDALFQVRGLDPGTVGVIPIMSADRTEATDRFHTIKKVLGACGAKRVTKKGEDVAEDIADYRAGGLGITYESTTLPSGGGVIVTRDSQGHRIEFRIYPARITGAVGYTAVAGLCDEVDLWPVDLGTSQEAVEEAARKIDGGKANPADVVLDRLLERFTTAFEDKSAHLYIVSASYKGEDSAHARWMKNGDDDTQRVARLGKLGAKRDEEQRRRLAAAIGSDDPRLLAPADPMSINIPAWATNAAAPIESCYKGSRGRLGPMFGRYGGRPDEATDGRHPDSMAGVKIAREAVPWP